MDSKLSDSWCGEIGGFWGVVLRKWMPENRHERKWLWTNAVTERILDQGAAYVEEGQRPGTNPFG